MLVIVSCKEDLSDGIPAYIRIDNITVIDTTDNRSITDTNSYRNIIDAWVRINGIKKGVYELPANFPVPANFVCAWSSSPASSSPASSSPADTERQELPC